MAKRLGKIPVWRERAREKIKSLSPGARQELRGDIARELNAESNRRIFKRLKIKSKERREKAEIRLDRVKAASLRTWKPNLSEEEIQERATRVTMATVGRSARAKKEALFVQDKRGRWFRAKTVKTKTKSGKTFQKTVRTGKPISQGSVSRSLGARAYWRRIKSTARVFGISIKEARSVDKILLNVPEDVRRRIYERKVREASRKRRPSRKAGKRRKTRAR